MIYRKRKGDKRRNTAKVQMQQGSKKQDGKNEGNTEKD